MSELRSGPDSPPREGSAPDPAHGIPLGSWAGVPIRADWSALLALALFAWVLAAAALPGAAPGRSSATYWLAGTVTALVFFGTLVAHEIAHALVARHYGMRVRGLTLWVLGGSTELDAEPPTPRADGWIAASGPLTSIGIGLAAGLLTLGLGAGSLPQAAVGWLAGVSVMLGVLNLLPGAPLDGGRVMRALLWWRWRDRARATLVAARAGRALGIGLVALGALEILAGGLSGIWLALVGWYVMSAASAQAASVALEPIRALRAGQVMTPAPIIAADWLTVERFVVGLGHAAVTQRAFPLVDVEGAVTGAVTLQDLTRVPPVKRGTTRLRQVRGATRPDVLLLRPDTVLGDVWEQLARHRGIAVVVDGHGAPIGVMTRAELQRAGELSGMGWRPHSEHHV